MNALFLLLDEELTNARDGRARCAYNPQDIAYWLNFYSLFFDTVYLPANQLLDSNLAGDVLRTLKISSQDSTLRGGEDMPFRILWDTSRFGNPCGFTLLLKTLESDLSYVTMRNQNIARDTAEQCDRYLRSYQIVTANLTAHLDPKESIEQLRWEAFNKEYNEALEAHTLDRMRECLEKIVERGDLEQSGGSFGYGRVFYYTIWGYTANEQQVHRERQFSDVVRPYMALKDRFLTAVDYVSHSLKARFAADTLKQQIDIIMPKEYARAVIAPGKSFLLKLYRNEGSDTGHRQSTGILLSPQSVLNMTAVQLAALHGSHEYHDYRKAIQHLNNLAIPEIDSQSINGVEQSFAEYLNLIERTLVPARNAAANLFRFIPKVAAAAAGVSAHLIAKPDPSLTTKIGGQAIELWAKNTALPSKIEGFLIDRHVDPLPLTIRLSPEVKRYLV